MTPLLRRVRVILGLGVSWWFPAADRIQLAPHPLDLCDLLGRYLQKRVLQLETIVMSGLEGLNCTGPPIRRIS